MTAENFYSQQTAPSSREKSEGLLSPRGILSLFVLALLTTLGLSGYLSVERESRAALASELQTILNAHVEALHIWIENEKSSVQAWADNGQVRETILELLQKGKENESREAKSSFPEALIRLREILGPVCKINNYIGFVIIEPGGLQIGALLDEPVGQRELIKRSDFIQRSLRGETVVSLPFKGEVLLPDRHGEFKPGQPTMFVSSPVLDHKGNIAAVLAFRIKPAVEFTHLLESGRLKSTGETYAFNSAGLMISDSRFNNQLKQIGLIPDHPDSRAILNVQVRNPGGNILEGFLPELPRNRQPLTRMAASAIAGISEIDLDIYNDYRGVPVVGAWTWLSQYGFGVATEIDADEAFIYSRNIRELFMFLFSLLTLSTVCSLFLQDRRLQIKKAHTQTAEALMDSAAYTRAILNNASDAIITIDETGLINSFNPAAEKLFGYEEPEIKGRNVTLLLPDGYRNRHVNRLKNYLTSGDPKIIGAPFEAMGLRKDYTAFPMELSVSEMWVGQKRRFISIIKNISRRKHAEEQMRLRSRQQEVIARLGQEALAGKDIQKLRETATGLITETLHVEFARVLTLKSGSADLHLETVVDGEKGLSANAASNEEIKSQANFTLNSKRPVVVEDFKSETRFSIPPLHEDRGIVSGMTVIIQGKEKPLGVLAAHSAHKRRFTESDIHFLQAVANILAIAAEQKEAEESIREARDFLELRVEERTADLKNVNNRLQEEIIQRQSAEEKIKSALREKDILLREIHHRSKNNLQLISSLLQLQSREISDTRYSEKFMESYNRIKSIAVLHDLIFQSPTLDNIDIRAYFTAIAKNLFNSYGTAKNIRLTVRADGLTLDVDRCIHCGLIVNEIVSNSLKHGFANDQEGEILIQAKALDPNMVELKVSDTGRGFPTGFDINKTGSLGMMLVTTLAIEQLEGNLDYRNNPGAEITIVFPGAADK